MRRIGEAAEDLAPPLFAHGADHEVGLATLNVRLVSGGRTRASAQADPLNRTWSALDLVIAAAAGRGVCACLFMITTTNALGLRWSLPPAPQRMQCPPRRIRQIAVLETGAPHN